MKLRILSITLLSINFAFANMAPPSIQIYSIGGDIVNQDDELIINSEELSFDCYPSRNYCDVKALYKFKSKVSEKTFSFISPSKNKIQALVNDQTVKVITSNLANSPLFQNFVMTQVPIMGNFKNFRISNVYEGEKKSFKFSNDESEYIYDPTLKGWRENNTPQLQTSFEAIFETRLNVGENKITISYKQEMSTLRTPGYILSSPRKFKSFYYDLWPIKGWKKGNDFQIKMNVKINQDISLWSKLFFDEENFSCKNLNAVNDVTSHKNIQTNFDDISTDIQMIYFVFKKKIPNRIVCHILI